jgi:hypothetical protein
MTWLINVDNGGTATGFCLVDGSEALSRGLTARVNDLAARGARRLARPVPAWPFRTPDMRSSL